MSKALVDTPVEIHSEPAVVPQAPAPKYFGVGFVVKDATDSTAAVMAEAKYTHLEVDEKLSISIAINVIDAEITDELRVQIEDKLKKAVNALPLLLIEELNKTGPEHKIDADVLIEVANNIAVDEFSRLLVHQTIDNDTVIPPSLIGAVHRYVIDDIRKELAVDEVPDETLLSIANMAVTHALLTGWPASLKATRVSTPQAA